MSQKSSTQRLEEQLSERILVMDDERLVRDVMRRTLESLGCTVSVASDGAEAVELAEEASSGLVAALADVAEVLTAEQRRELIEVAQRFHDH